MISSIHSWNVPPKKPRLSSNEIHIWRVFLAETASNLESLKQTLSDDEQTKAARFYFQKDRDRFIVARGVLRTILSSYLDINPCDLNFCYNFYGKPSLVPNQGGKTLRFNLSHSDEIALISITKNREIGIDVERIRTNFPYQQIAEKFFSASENSVLLSLPENLQPQAFFNCWTRKEAYIKAVGKGLSLPLNCFDVTLKPGEPAAFLHFQDNPEELSKWSLIELIPGRDQVAALAVEGSGYSLYCWQW